MSKVISIDSKLQEFSKSILKSKTMWASVVLPLVATLVPPAAPWIAANPETAAWVVGGLMAGLRLISHKQVKLPELPGKK